MKNYFAISCEKWAEIVKQYFNEPNIGNQSRVLSILIIPNPHSYLTPCTQVTVHRSLYMCTVRYSPSLQAGSRPVPVSWAGVRVSCFHEPGEVSDGWWHCVMMMCDWHVAIVMTWEVLRPEPVTCTHVATCVCINNKHNMQAWDRERGVLPGKL